MPLRDEFSTQLRYYHQGSTLTGRRRWNGRNIVNRFGSNFERHRRELLAHCYRMLGPLPDAGDAVRETSLRAWRYRDSLKEGAPLRLWLYRVATKSTRGESCE